MADTFFFFIAILAFDKKEERKHREDIMKLKRVVCCSECSPVSTGTTDYQDKSASSVRDKWNKLRSELKCEEVDCQ